MALSRWRQAQANAASTVSRYTAIVRSEPYRTISVAARFAVGSAVNAASVTCWCPRQPRARRPGTGPGTGACQRGRPTQLVGRGARQLGYGLDTGQLTPNSLITSALWARVPNTGCRKIQAETSP